MPRFSLLLTVFLAASHVCPLMAQPNSPINTRWTLELCNTGSRPLYVAVALPGWWYEHEIVGWHTIDSRSCLKNVAGTQTGMDDVYAAFAARGPNGYLREVSSAPRSKRHYQRSLKYFCVTTDGFSYRSRSNKSGKCKPGWVRLHFPVLFSGLGSDAGHTYLKYSVDSDNLGKKICPGCGGDEPEERATTTDEAQVVHVSDVTLGNTIGADYRIVTETGTFRPPDTIYVSVETTGTSPGADLTARWTYEDGQVVDETSRTIAPDGPAVTEFHVSKPDGWPTGEYEVVILLNGQQAERASFRVEDGA